MCVCGDDGGAGVSGRGLQHSQVHDLPPAVYDVQQHGLSAVSGE